MANSYHKNTLKSIRSGLNRHLSDIGRTTDIIRGQLFKPANRTLDGLLKDMTRAGTSRPTQHKAVVEDEDLRKISTYFQESESSPITLRQCVWFNICIHFVSRGLEFHQQLKRDSLDFNFDQEGHEYVTLNHETQQKNFQGGLTNEEAPTDRRMYSTGGKNCPVATLKFFLMKTDPDAEYLFNGCVKEALAKPYQTDLWYGKKALAKRTFSNFMTDISKSSECSRYYTGHCLRATAIKKLNDHGFDARHIMFMSGHRNENSLQSYTRRPSTNRKKALSSTLSTICQPDDTQSLVPCPGPSSVTPSSATPSSVSQTSVSQSGVTFPVSGSVPTIFESSTFHGCSFNIMMKQ